MNISTFILAFVFLAIYLKDSILLRLKHTHFPISGMKTAFIESVNFGLKYATYILVSCVIASILIALTQMIKKHPVADKVQSVINAHALLCILTVISVMVILPCVKGIAVLLSNGSNDLFTVWLFVILFLGFTFAVSVFVAMKAEWSKVIAPSTTTV